MVKRNSRFRTGVGAALAFVGVGSALSAPADAASDAQCTALLSRSDVYVAGKLSEVYRKALIDSGRAVSADGTVDRVTIVNGCNAGAFDPVLTALEPNAPVSVVSGFTEAEARSQFERSGFANVTNLMKDSQNIWRASATHAGKPVAVTLDLKILAVAQ